MDGAVRAQGGVVQAFTGDGIMAVFGAPVAFEDAPLRACRAALTIQQQLVGRFQSSNHMGCPKRPHSVDGRPKMQLSGFMESVV
jgi:class 3 adenylate cyclase